MRTRPRTRHRGSSKRADEGRLADAASDREPHRAALHGFEPPVRSCSNGTDEADRRQPSPRGYIKGFGPRYHRVRGGPPATRTRAIPARFACPRRSSTSVHVLYGAGEALYLQFRTRDRFPVLENHYGTWSILKETKRSPEYHMILNLNLRRNDLYALPGSDLHADSNLLSSEARQEDADSDPFAGMGLTLCSPSGALSFQTDSHVPSVRSSPLSRTPDHVWAG